MPKLFPLLAAVSAAALLVTAGCGDEPADPPTPQVSAGADAPAPPRSDTGPATPGAAYTRPASQPAVVSPTPSPTEDTPTAAADRIQPRPSPAPTDTDRDALAALYDATEGPDWDDNANWLSDEPLDTWHGVTTDDSGRVIELNLDGSGLSGAIPTELGNLVDLRVLDLSRNQLSGNMPSGLGGLVNLTHLNLSSNRLSGRIPPELGNLADLEDLRLSDNQLSGPVPPEVGDLSALRALLLDGNRLTGELPHGLTSIATTEDLPFLYFHDNAGLCAPDEAGFLAWLRRVQHTLGFICEPTGDRELLVALYRATDGDRWYRNDNWLSNDPWKPLDAWHGVTIDESGRVTGLALRRNGLRGTIPPELGSLARLNSLDLGRNYLSGRIPPELGNLASLTMLYLGGDAWSDRHLSGQIPSALGALSNLVELDLSDNQLSGTIPSELGNLTRLTKLYLDNNQFSGTLHSLTRLSALKRFSFAGNPDLCATDDDQIRGWLNRVALLALYDAAGGPNWTNKMNWLTSEPLTTWYGVITDDSGRVIRLHLGGNALRGTIPPELGNLSNLTELILGDSPPLSTPTAQSSTYTINQLSGEIPSELASLTDLRVLDLGGNDLSGQIPTELSRLSELERLDLHYNGLWGTIPRELGILTNLTLLNLGGNSLDGNIPSELGNLPNLTGLYLWGNRLSGEIPSELASLASLASLNLSDNQLRGEIPREFTALSALTDLDFEGNIGLCAPADETFQRWLNRIDWQGDVCQ